MKLTRKIVESHNLPNITLSDYVEEPFLLSFNYYPDAFLGKVTTKANIDIFPGVLSYKHEMDISTESVIVSSSSYSNLLYSP